MVNSQYMARNMASNLTTVTELILNITRQAEDQKRSMECQNYGTFMQHTPRSSLEFIFWVPFVAAIICLILAAASHERSERTYWHGKHHPEERNGLKLKQRNSRIYAVLATTVLALAVLTCVILEALAGCALTYCDERHKLIWFYWGMWTLLQVGSLIAIIGITVHQWACLGEHSTPPWNVALGTPILVITGLAHIWGTWIAKKWRKWTGAEKTQPSNRSFLNPEATDHPLLSAVTVDGHIVVEFPSTWQPTEQPGQKVLGHNEFGGSIIEYLPTELPYTKEELQAKVAALRQRTSGISSGGSLTLGSQTIATPSLEPRPSSIDIGNQKTLSL